MSKNSSQKTLSVGLIVSCLTLGASIIACKKPRPETSALYQNQATSEQSAGTVEQISETPVLKTEPKCEDQRNGEEGHSTGTGMNHCPPKEAKAKAGNPKEAKASSSEPKTSKGL